MVDRKYVAEFFMERLEKSQSDENNLNLKETEKDELLFWILGTLKTVYPRRLKVTGCFKGGGGVMLSSNSSTYCSKYLKREEFLKALDELAKEIDSYKGYRAVNFSTTKHIEILIFGN